MLRSLVGSEMCIRDSIIQQPSSHSKVTPHTDLFNQILTLDRHAISYWPVRISMNGTTSRKLTALSRLVSASIWYSPETMRLTNGSISRKSISLRSQNLGRRRHRDLRSPCLTERHQPQTNGPATGSQLENQRLGQLPEQELHKSTRPAQHRNS